VKIKINLTNLLSKDTHLRTKLIHIKIIPKKHHQRPTKN